MITAWRILKPAFISNAFDGEGARIYGGRWNNKGTAIIYVAESISLAAIELLVHVESHEIMENYISIPIQFEEKFVQILNLSTLPTNWKAQPAPLSTKIIGDKWISDQSSVILEVPSVIVPTESNFLINPNHKDFSKIRIGVPQPFDFDSRLLKF